MTKIIATFIAAALMCGVNAASAQNVKSDQDRAQGQEKKMQEKEQGAPSAGAQQGAPSVDAAKQCKGMTGRAKEQCMKKNAPATGQSDSGAAQHQETQKPKK